MRIVRITATVLCAAAITGMSYMAADAAATIKSGTLTCNVEGGMGYIFGSSRNLECIFESSGGKVEKYAGTIKKFGVDVGITGAAKMAWIVLSAGKKIEKGALAGKYSGVSADAAVGIGGGAKILVGVNDQISLQPLSLQVNTGLSVAAGIAALELNSVK